jgi:hypothetical protein
VEIVQLAEMFFGLFKTCVWALVFLIAILYVFRKGVIRSGDDE